jgi:hypothetical protein
MPTRTSVRGRDSTLGGKTSLPKRKTLGKQGVVPQPVKPQPKPRKESYTKTLTEPKEFKFQTELRAHPMNLRTHPGAKGGGVQVGCYEFFESFARLLTLVSIYLEKDQTRQTIFQDDGSTETRAHGSTALPIPNGIQGALEGCERGATKVSVRPFGC